MFSSFRDWFQQHSVRSLLPRRRKVSRSGRRSTRGLGLEVLEGRTLPAAALSITPISWNVIGLDSNNVNAGPNRFLVGARVTNTGNATATNVQTSYAWDSANPLINLESQSTQSVASLAPGASADFYYDVFVTRD